MILRKLIVSGILSIGILIGSSGFIVAQNAGYSVKSGDTFWKIGQQHGISTVSLMRANNATASTILYPGQTLVIPIVYTVKPGDSYWIISKNFGVDFQKLIWLNNAIGNSTLNIGDKVYIPPVQTFRSVANTKPYVTYENYTVQKGENSWSIATKFGLPVNELLNANNISSSTVLNIGQVIKIPVHHIPVKSTPGEKYGELLDWWSEAQYVIPRGTNFEVVDFYTGKSFFARRTTGSNHADCETLTLQDTNKMKEIWGGSFSWVRRPVIIKYNGRKIAASMTAMPHAGNEYAPAEAWTTWRSGEYGAGTNYDYIKGNGIDGHFDIHFLNSTRHSDGAVDAEHQAVIKVSSGIK